MYQSSEEMNKQMGSLILTNAEIGRLGGLSRIQCDAAAQTRVQRINSLYHMLHGGHPNKVPSICASKIAAATLRGPGRPTESGVSIWPLSLAPVPPSSLGWCTHSSVLAHPPQSTSQPLSNTSSSYISIQNFSLKIMNSVTVNTQM